MSIYLDLFDDAIYEPKSLYRNDGYFSYELNLLRMHIFLWLLFGKKIIVPEQWAVSSASFQIVIGELLMGKRNAEEFTGRVYPNPIKILTIDRGVNAEDALAGAFVDSCLLYTSPSPRD